MIITGTIDHVQHRSYYRNDKKINYYEVLVSYNFYNGVNQILLLAKDFDKRYVSSKDQLFVFDFDAATKFINGKLTTDFYLHECKPLTKKDGNSLVVVRTYFEKDKFEVLQKQDVKGRTKIFAKFTSKDPNQPPLHCYFWEDNHFLVDLNKVNKIQLNCRSLPYKDKFISNIEIWRTMDNDNFIGSIL